MGPLSSYQHEVPLSENPVDGVMAEPVTAIRLCGPSC